MTLPIITYTDNRMLVCLEFSGNVGDTWVCVACPWHCAKWQVIARLQCTTLKRMIPFLRCNTNVGVFAWCIDNTTKTSRSNEQYCIITAQKTTEGMVISVLWMGYCSNGLRAMYCLLWRCLPQSEWAKLATNSRLKKAKSSHNRSSVRFLIS